ncbi:hypothetical protein D3C72_1964310 [compost metagenome]
MRVLAGEGLDCGRCTTVGVAFTQDRVHGAAEDLAVTRVGLFFRFGLRVFREVGDVVALGLQLGDGALELRYRGADIG